MKVNRAERQRILIGRAGEQIKALRKDPYMTAFLDLCDQLEAEGVGQTVDALFSEFKRSGHGGGFLLETLCAGSLLAVPTPRAIRSEQKEGMAKIPGDIWLDFEGRRYEFPCKDAKNWTVELWVNEAVDAIAVDLAGVQPGRFYELNPAIEGTQAQWRSFRDWFVREFSKLAPDTDHRFAIEGRLIAKVRIFGDRPTGVILGISTSPGDVEMMNISMLRDTSHRASWTYRRRPRPNRFPTASPTPTPPWVLP